MNHYVQCSKFIADIAEPFKCEQIKGDSTNWEIKKELMYDVKSKEMKQEKRKDFFLNTS